jgi:hypothetical protein
VAWLACRMFACCLPSCDWSCYCCSGGNASEAESAFCRIVMRTLAKRQVDFTADAVATISFALRHWADWRSTACSPQLHHEALTTLAAFVPLCISKASPFLA